MESNFDSFDYFIVLLDSSKFIPPDELEMVDQEDFDSPAGSPVEQSAHNGTEAAAGPPPLQNGAWVGERMPPMRVERFPEVVAAGRQRSRNREGSGGEEFYSARGTAPSEHSHHHGGPRLDLHHSGPPDHHLPRAEDGPSSYITSLVQNMGSTRRGLFQRSLSGELSERFAVGPVGPDVLGGDFAFGGSDEDFEDEFDADGIVVDEEGLHNSGSEYDRYQGVVEDWEGVPQQRSPSSDASPIPAPGMGAVGAAWDAAAAAAWNGAAGAPAAPTPKNVEARNFLSAGRVQDPSLEYQILNPALHSAQILSSKSLLVDHAAVQEAENRAAFNSRPHSARNNILDEDNAGRPENRTSREDNEGRFRTSVASRASNNSVVLNASMYSRRSSAGGGPPRRSSMDSHAGAGEQNPAGMARRSNFFARNSMEGERDRLARKQQHEMDRLRAVAGRALNFAGADDRSMVEWFVGLVNDKILESKGDRVFEHAFVINKVDDCSRDMSRRRKMNCLPAIRENYDHTWGQENRGGVSFIGAGDLLGELCRFAMVSALSTPNPPPQIARAPTIRQCEGGLLLLTSTPNASHCAFSTTAATASGLPGRCSLPARGENFALVSGPALVSLTDTPAPAGTVEGREREGGARPVPTSCAAAGSTASPGLPFFSQTPAGTAGACTQSYPHPSPYSPELLCRI